MRIVHEKKGHKLSYDVIKATLKISYLHLALASLVFNITSHGIGLNSP